MHTAEHALISCNSFLPLILFPLKILDLNPGQIWFAGEITILHTAGISWY